MADAEGLILLAPDSRDTTWDVARTGAFGGDVDFVDRALDLVLARYAVDPSRVVAEGFSDGASYALALGLLNGDLFTHLIAFSPGFLTEGSRRGEPRLFVSHGVRDRVLPIELCSRRIVKDLRGDHYDVLYTEFEGGHGVPDAIARAALDWLAGRG
jgi:phospholipase/carboxylesterase